MPLGFLPVARLGSRLVVTPADQPDFVSLPPDHLKLVLGNLFPCLALDEMFRFPVLLLFHNQKIGGREGIARPLPRY